MTQNVKYAGYVIREFSNRGDLDAYLADRVFEWTEQGFGYEALLGSDYLELRTDRGNTVTLTFSFVSDYPFGEGSTLKHLFD